MYAKRRKGKEKKEQTNKQTKKEQKERDINGTPRGNALDGQTGRPVYTDDYRYQQGYVLAFPFYEQI